MWPCRAPVDKRPLGLGRCITSRLHIKGWKVSLPGPSVSHCARAPRLYPHPLTPQTCEHELDLFHPPPQKILLIALPSTAQLRCYELVEGWVQASRAFVWHHECEKAGEWSEWLAVLYSLISHAWNKLRSCSVLCIARGNTTTTRCTLLVALHMDRQAENANTWRLPPTMQAHQIDEMTVQELCQIRTRMYRD